MAKPTRATRGPKPKFLDVACPNSRCQHRGKTGLGNVVSNGTYRTRRTGRARLFLCRACGKAFSSRTGTAFFGLRTRKRTVLLGLQFLAEGLGCAAPLGSWRSSWTPSAAGWRWRLSSAITSATSSFGSCGSPRCRSMSSGPSLKKHPDPHGPIIRRPPCAERGSAGRAWAPRGSGGQPCSDGGSRLIIRGWWS